MKSYFMILSELLLTLSLLVGIVEKKEAQIKEEFYTILIDPGHGGRDNGAAINGVLEDDINLEISNKLFERCISENFITYITRNGDYDLSKEYSKNHKNEDLKKRVEYINTLDIDFFISIHLNTYPSEGVNGPMVYYKKDDEDSKNVALKVQNNSGMELPATGGNGTTQFTSFGSILILLAGGLLVMRKRNTY